MVDSWDWVNEFGVGQCLVRVWSEGRGSSPLRALRAGARNSVPWPEHLYFWEVQYQFLNRH